MLVQPHQTQYPRRPTKCWLETHNSSAAVGFSGSSSKPGTTITTTNSGHVVENDFNYKRPEHNDEAAPSQQSIPVLVTKRPNSKKLRKDKKPTNLKTIKRSNKLIETLNLPIVMNVNPRSIYNKCEEFHKFVKEETVEVIFMSESWERPEKPLQEIINLPDHTVISNPHQR